MEAKLTLLLYVWMYAYFSRDGIQGIVCAKQVHLQLNCSLTLESDLGEVGQFVDTSLCFSLHTLHILSLKSQSDSDEDCHFLKINYWQVTWHFTNTVLRILKEGIN